MLPSDAALTSFVDFLTYTLYAMVVPWALAIYCNNRKAINLFRVSACYVVLMIMAAIICLHIHDPAAPEQNYSRYGHVRIV